MKGLGGEGGRMQGLGGGGVRRQNAGFREGRRKYPGRPMLKPCTLYPGRPMLMPCTAVPYTAIRLHPNTMAWSSPSPRQTPSSLEKST